MLAVPKVHVALNAPRFEQSVAFYRAFFGSEPAKLKPGYAKFDVAEPALNLTLNQVAEPPAGVPAGAPGGPGGLNHLGIQVVSSDAVRAAAERLRQAGLATFEERDTDCCYALQDKVWVTDPNGYRWEVFVVKGGDTRPDLAVTGPAASTPCCAA
jgi:catechol 2,3-dioxygenase-like lactoylglutathione lyase family enzyme